MQSLRAAVNGNEGGGAGNDWQQYFPQAETDLQMKMKGGTWIDSGTASRGSLILGTYKHEGFSLSYPVLAPNIEKVTFILTTSWGFQTQGKTVCSVKLVEVIQGSS